jgi:hypothetical protein
VVEDCVEGLGKCLRGERIDTAIRKQIIQTLYDVYDFDSGLYNDEPVMSSEVPPMLMRKCSPQVGTSMKVLTVQVETPITLSTR